MTLSEAQFLAQQVQAVITTSSELSFLLDLLALLVSALIFSWIFARLRISLVSGQIIAGLVVGPYVLGWITNPIVLNQLSEIGVVLLLFVIGLELDPKELRKIILPVSTLTILETGIAFSFALLASYLLHFDLLESIIFSMAASITSTAIVGKIFLSKRIMKSPESGFLIGLLVVEDIIAIGFLIVLSSLTSTNISSFPFYAIGNSMTSRGFFAALEAILGGLALVGLAYGVSHYVAPRILNFLSSFEEEFEEIPFLFGLGLGFVFAVIAVLLGYSPGIGAFIVGLSIQGKQSKFLSKRISPIKDLFLILFFVSMGSLIDPLPALAIGFPIVVAILLLILGKFIGGFSVGKIINIANRNLKLKLVREARRGSFAIEGGIASPSTFGSWLIPRGEFSLIIGQLGLTLSLIDVQFFSLIGISVLVTAIVGSVLQRFTEPRRAASIYPFKSKQDSDERI